MRSKLRRVHTWVGLTLFVPLLAWASTGIVFLVKPGYAGAYEMLSIKTYPVSEAAASANAAPQSWDEIRRLRTILGDHLLVRSGQSWQQLDPQSLAPRQEPSADDVRRLIADAVTQNAARYGELSTVDGLQAQTTTRVAITLDWNRLSLSQHGEDTEWIDFLYRIHYLQWTRIDAIDRVLGVAGIVLIFALSGLGVVLWRRG